MANYLTGYGKENCGHCGLKRTAEGHDGCVGTLPDVLNACCGHGEEKMAYVQFTAAKRISGQAALEFIENTKVVAV